MLGVFGERKKMYAKRRNFLTIIRFRVFRWGECGKCFSWSEHALRHRGGSEIHWPSQEAVEKKTFQHVNNNVTSAGEFDPYRCDERESVSFGNMTCNVRSDVIVKFYVPVVSDDIARLSK